ncbi:hypothetical protein AMTRI_Chr02g218060 [Amborella trichopoda]|uniref:B box-type domain-containing protein n=1 Tax=Amborella trichopoda TaxID=13333 RepID=W1NUM9_AMBTC|nr:zinc finger protein CONSTANS-LIKE 4 [Amborella trichopoda]ERM98369.1 hypothetical protein AMTR_s00072p00015740 [Amborella trichopoda]|eukprot:XP_006833091.1 zinc finger protein CONSTANS-LIKE 4 [Amborella trichopoda]
MRDCELCDLPAMMYCESDQASLCLECDAKVHGANFLVARHSRCLLCQVCQCPTPWRASGSKLGSAVSLCEKCVNSRHKQQSQHEEEEDGEEEEEEEDEEEEEMDDEADNGENVSDGDSEDGENQVVPWSLTPPPPPPPPSRSVPLPSSSSEESSQGRLNMKRLRDNADLHYQEGFGSSSSSPQRGNDQARSSGEDEANSISSCRPLKDRKRESMISVRQRSYASKSDIVQALRRLQQQRSDPNSSSINCRISKDHSPVDVLSTGSESPPV